VRFDNLSLGAIETAMPRLSLERDGTQAVLSWPATRRAAALETTASLAPTNWLPIAGVPIVDGQFQYNTPVLPGAKFFRLHRP